VESDDELNLITISMPGELGRQSAHVVSLYCKHNQTGAPMRYRTRAVAAYLDVGGETRAAANEVN